MNELKGFEPVAWQLRMPDELSARLFHHTKEQSVGAEHRWKNAYSGCKHEPLYTADQIAAVVQQRDELLLAATNLIRVRGRHHTEQAYKQLEAAIKKVQP